MSSVFGEKFASHYGSRVFPWALNYDCGGAEYPDLVSDWEKLEKQLGDHIVSELKERWRRTNSEPPLLL
eukprot:11031030-Karenia_brevis.AAC.1